MEVCIVTKRSFLSCSTTQRQNHGAFNFTSLNDAILQLPRLSVYALYGFIQRGSHVLLPVALFVFATLGCLSKLWCSNAAYISQLISLQNRFFFILFVWSCCLLLPLFYKLDLSFSHLLVSLFCAYKLLYPCTT